MTQEQAEQTKFEGWAILEIFGHQRYAGYVSTQVFGTAVMFRIDVPALEERETIAKCGTYCGDVYAPTGSKIKLGAVQAYTKLFGVGAVYAMTPCTQEAAIRAVEGLQNRPMILVQVPAAKRLGEGPEHVCPATGIPSDDCDCPACVGDLDEVDTSEEFDSAEGV